MFAAFLQYVLPVFAWSIAGLWLAAFFWTRRELAVLNSFGRQKFLLNKEPRVSILLPARNEANRILRECVDSLLAQNYRNFEIIALDDRSTDDTNRILRRIAKTNDKLKTIAGAELPANWLGKPFALQQAFENANGEWILTTDADIRFAPDAIQKAVAFATENRLDALCLIPFVRCETFWEKIFIPTFNWFRMLAMPPSRVNNQNKSDAMGIGNFFLIRRRALEQINGFESVKSDVAEDLRLAQTLKRNSFRIETRYAPRLLETRMYAGFREIWRGFTKNFFAGSNFSLVNAASGVGSIALFGVLPALIAVGLLIAAIFGAADFRLLAPFVIIYLLQTAVFARLLREYEQSVFYAVCAVCGLGLFAMILCNSTAKVLSGSGVEWKDREIYKSGGARQSI